MASVAVAIPFAYPVLPHSGRPRRSRAFHEPGARYRASPLTPRPDDASVRRRVPDVPPPRVRLHLKPGQKGTRQLLEQYVTASSACATGTIRHGESGFKTVEVVVAERPWQPPPSRLASDRLVSLRIAFAEAELRRRVSRPVAGGTRTSGPGSCHMIARSRSAWNNASSRPRHPVLDARPRPASISMQMPDRHLDADACIHHRMPASTARCDPVPSNSSYASETGG